jgi:hypothetical protein
MLQGSKGECMTLAAYAEETERLAERYKLPVFPMGDAVPKTINQTFPTKVLPADLQANIDRLRGTNPDWDYHLYDDAEVSAFVSHHYGSKILEMLNRIRPGYGAARADLFRYLLMYRTGGVYLDIKSGFDRPINQAIEPNERFLISQWDTSNPDFAAFGQHKEIEACPGGEFENWQIITVPGHPFLRAVIARVLHNIDIYNPWRHGTGGSGTYRVTGPTAYTRAIVPLLDRYPHRIVTDSEVGLVYAMAKRHKQHFKGHYLSRTDSIIEQCGPARLLGWSYSLARQLKRRVAG